MIKEKKIKCIDLPSHLPRVHFQIEICARTWFEQLQLHQSLDSPLIVENNFYGILCYSLHANYIKMSDLILLWCKELA